MKNRFQLAVFACAALASLGLASCLEGSTKTTLDVSGPWTITTDPVKMGCKEQTTGLSFSMTTLPSMTFNVNISEKDGVINLHSEDFAWNAINMRLSPAYSTNLPGTDIPGTINEDGVFVAEMTEEWDNPFGSAGPVTLTRRFEGKFIDRGVDGLFSVELTLKNYNSYCQGSSGFTGHKTG